MSNSIQDIFLNEKPAKVLIKIRRTREDLCMSDIQKKIDTTYAHTVKVINNLENRGLLQTEENGRSKTVTLTDHGEELVQPLAEFMQTARKVAR